MQLQLMSVACIAGGYKFKFLPPVAVLLLRLIFACYHHGQSPVAAAGTQTEVFTRILTAK